MGIIYADKIGFCMGVRRAVSLLEEALAVEPGRSLATYGPLIHNPQVVAAYEARGVRCIDKPDDVQAGERVIIRAHGVPSQVRRELDLRGAEIIDATCPKVALSIRKAREAEALGRQVLLVGDAGHGEMLAIAGSLDNPAAVRVITGGEAAETIPLADKVSVIAQTTFDGGLYARIAEILSSRVADCRIEYSICPATRLRQDAVRKLAAQVDGIVVIGGRNSANTRRLYEIAVASGIPVWQVEGPDDVPSAVACCPVIGISAGASTPDESIRLTAERIEMLQAGGL